MFLRWMGSRCLSNVKMHCMALTNSSAFFRIDGENVQVTGDTLSLHTRYSGIPLSFSKYLAMKRPNTESRPTKANAFMDNANAYIV